MRAKHRSSESRRDVRPDQGSSGKLAAKWWLVAWAALLVAAAIVAWIAFPAWLTGDESGSTTIRNLGLVILAAVGLPLAVWRSVIAERQAQAAQRQSEVAAQNLLNDRFQKGAEMLGHPDIGSVRIGGVHALASLAAEYPAVFHLPVMRTLAAFVVDRTKDGRPMVEQESADLGESRDYSGHAPVEVFLAASREVGRVPELAKDVEEAMRSISQRGETQIAVEKDVTFRVNLAHAAMPGFIFNGADLSGFDFTKADMRRVRGWEACLVGSRLVGADLSGASMAAADLRDADMRRVNLTAADLVGADLKNANLGLVDIVSENLWQGVTFPSKLVGVQLMGADLRNANICRADMRGASLQGAKLDDADFHGSNLSGADLAGAKLAGANLSNANLAGTNLTGTDFSPSRPDGDASPAHGLTQGQLDQAIADPGNPPILEGALDSETNEPLSWRGDSEGQSECGDE